MKEKTEELITKKEKDLIRIRTKCDEKMICITLDGGVTGYTGNLEIPTAKYLVMLLESTLKEELRDFFYTDGMEQDKYHFSIRRKNDTITIGMDECIVGMWVDMDVREVKKLIKILNSMIKKVEKYIENERQERNKQKIEIYKNRYAEGV